MIAGSGPGVSRPGEGGREREFHRLTILTFLQSSLVQSVALSHRDIQPVSQYDGLQVSVEYVDQQHQHHHHHQHDQHDRHLHCYRPKRR